MFDIKNKVALITGGANGLGLDAARAYVGHGVKIALLDRDTASLAAAQKELLASGGDVIAVACDVTKEAQVAAAAERVLAEFGRIDILLNNAGILRGGTVESITEKTWDLLMEVNVKSMYLVSKYVVPQMKIQSFGRIINLSSFNAMIADKTDGHARHAYITSKAAVLGLTNAMAATYAKYGITVNALMPGYFNTNITRNILFENESLIAEHNAANPTGRAAGKGDLNGIILFLSGNASSYITGQHIKVDGGFSII